MKFSKEARIGLLVAISVVVLFAGFYFLKGSNVFSKDYDYYAFYGDVQGLQLSAAQWGTAIAAEAAQPGGPAYASGQRTLRDADEIAQAVLGV